MRPLTVPGFLVEGSFHDYEPETHRLLNDDYAKLTAVCLHRFFCDRFDADKTGKGVIAGSVKDSQRVMTHQYFNNFVKNSHDQYQPINGATISLMNASGNIIDTYTTDQYYNGIYVFRDLAPGNYKVKMEAEGYTSQTKEVTVTADKTTSFYTLLEDPNYIPPAKIPGKANIYASALSARKTDDGKYDLSFTLNADADAAQERMRANREAYEQGLAEAAAIREGRSESASANEKPADRKVEGRVMVSFSLVDPIRYSRHLVVPAYRCEGGGEVVVRITVNRGGEVVNASVVSGGDDCMRSTAVHAARNSRFDINDSAPARQNGTITYIFIPQ